MARLFVLAGTSGSGKSSIGGAMVRHRGADYYNPDEAALELAAANQGIDMREANSLAWHQGKRLLERAIDERLDFAFETTLGGRTITRLLAFACERGIEVDVWYVALATPELHIERVRARVARAGHDVPDDEIRKRFDTSRANLIELLPGLAALRVYDNSTTVDLVRGEPPQPQLLLRMVAGKVLAHGELGSAPDWVKPILVGAFALDPAALARGV